MTKTLSPCDFRWDGISDPRAPKPVERCAHCGLPKTHPRHKPDDALTPQEGQQ